jgi:glyoxylase-like metal-dependent hydrolase (beta-lactamase superfamily II)
MLQNSKKNYSVEIGCKKVELEGDILLEDGRVLELGNTKLNILHTPGHSKGSICIKCEDSLFSGDTLFAHSIGRTDLEGGSYEEIINSIKNKLMILPDETKVYPGHGSSTTIGEEKYRNPFLK